MQSHGETISATESRETDAGGIILFDGVCNFCNGWVRFVIRRDPRGQFRFAPLQSQIARDILAPRGLPPETLDTVVLIEGEKTFTRSTAALRIARRLRFPWPLVYYAAIWIPRRLRDLAYRFIAARRYRWFGKMGSCPVPSPQAASRFLAKP
jgi:predicted DCC family thiol-disulfide oxidoreductase YuxK